MAALLRGEQIVLLFFGDDKFDVYQRAAAGDDAFPVAALLSQQHTPVHIFWAP